MNTGTVVIIWLFDLQLPVQSVPITTNVASSNPVHGEMYSIRHYVIMFASDLQQDGFLWVLSISSTNKTDSHDITVKLLKVVLNTTPPLKVVISITVNVLYTTFICDLR